MRHWFIPLLVLSFVFLSSCTRKDSSSAPQAQKVVVKDLQRYDVRAGNGTVATPGKKAQVHVLVMTARGQTIQSSRAENQPETVTVTAEPENPPMGYYVEGMREGGLRRVTVPYGKEYFNEHESQEPIVIEIELLKVQ